MNYAFLENHKVIPINKITKKSQVLFYMIDISTDRKGPLFTLVKNVNNGFNSSIAKMTLSLSYTPYDLPFIEQEDIPTDIPVSTISEFYNLYPLIRQIFSFNEFMNMYSGEIDVYINIDEIVIHTNRYKITLDESATDEDIKNTFSKLNMLTSVSSILYNNEVIIIKNNTWDIINMDYVDFKKFDKLFIPLGEMECGYLMSSKMFNRLRNVKSLNISFTYEEFDSYDESYDDYNETIVSIPYFNEIILSLLFIPQYMLLEKSIYGTCCGLNMIIEYEDKCISLNITSEEAEVSKNLCLFIILKKLLKF